MNNTNFFDRPLFPDSSNKKYQEKTLGIHIKDKTSMTIEKIRQAGIRNYAKKIKNQMVYENRTKRGNLREYTHEWYNNVGKFAGISRKEAKGIIEENIQETGAQGEAITNIREKVEGYIKRIENIKKIGSYTLDELTQFTEDDKIKIIRNETNKIKADLKNETFTANETINEAIKKEILNFNTDINKIMSKIKMPQNQDELVRELLSVLDCINVDLSKTNTPEKLDQYKKYFYKLLSHLKYYNNRFKISDSPMQDNKALYEKFVKALNEALQKRLHN